MRYPPRLLGGLLAAVLLSSCGALPTLPPLDSTVSIFTPGITQQLVEDTATVQPATPAFTQTPGMSSTATGTARPGSPTPSPSATSRPATATQASSSTATFTPTLTTTPRPSATPTAVPYQLQGPNPFYLANFTHPQAGCSWMGIGGQVFNKQGQVQTGIIIKAGGTIAGKPVIETMVMPLTEPETDLAYGPGGFELTLANATADSSSEAWIQLFNLAGKPLSDKIYLVTYSDCQKNLILMNFIEK